jgi:hypothetical protein
MTILYPPFVLRRSQSQNGLRSSDIRGHPEDGKWRQRGNTFCALADGLFIVNLTLFPEEVASRIFHKYFLQEAASEP